MFKPLVNVHPNPGPTREKKNSVSCLYLNARSLVRKMDEFQTLTAEIDMVAVTKTWLTPNILDCELLPGSDFTIYRRDRVSRPGGGVMLAVRNTINSIGRSDLECSAEELVCEIRPSLKRKLLIVVFYRPPDSNLDYLKELKKSFCLANQARFDQLVVCGDFNLPHIDWEFGTATTGDSIHNYFTKLVRDNYLWQMIDFPTRNNNMLDSSLTYRRKFPTFMDLTTFLMLIINL